jgi:Cu(I)/Ag(I) efflux system membrane fusion protein
MKEAWMKWIRYAAFALAVVAAFWLGTSVVGEAESDTPTADGHEHGQAEVWTCSMHPQIRVDQAGQCPICGMDLIPATTDGGRKPADTGKHLTLSPEAAALAQVQVTEVQRTEPRAELRLLGHVEYDETRLRTVTPWTAGRIDTLHVRVTGERVKKGQVVAKLYSPEVYAAMRDLVLALKQAEKLEGGLHGSGALAKAAVESARERLRLLGVPSATLRKLEKTREAPTHVNVRSPFAGTVLERKVEEGNYVNTGTPLLSLADLSRVWVQIDAYESDLPFLRVDQEVLVEVESRPDEPVAGKITFIDPVVDRKQRTSRVRIEVDNPDGELRPGMFAAALVQGDAGTTHASQLTIPASAVLFTGRRSVVYVQTPGAERQMYELRTVRLGPRAGESYPVLSGLSERERVVTKGAFLLDADLQLAGGRSMMTLADDEASSAKPSFRVPAEFRVALAPVVQHYLAAQRALSGDDFDGAREALTAAAKAANEAEPPGSREAGEAWQTIASALAGHASHGAKAKQDGEVRIAFEHVSKQVEVLLETFGNPTDVPLKVAFCPMAFDASGAAWVQSESSVTNPYYGAAMLRCGEFRASVLPGETLARTGEDAAAPAASTEHQH